MKTEREVWDHYRDYLKEATGLQDIQLKPVLDNMRQCVSAGCSRLELKEMMKAVFTPITIMQSLEQWQNQMDMLLYTGMTSLGGLSRQEYYSDRKDESPYTMEMDAVVDNPDPSTPIYELSCISQDVIHLASEWGGRQSPELLREVQTQTGLQKNWELQMLIGDCYRQNQEFEKAIQVYENLWEENDHKDFSIQDAIVFTKYVKEKGHTIYGKKFGDWVDDFHDYKKQETIRRKSPKISRNDPCPCGSGKKYKQCCGR